nr:oocyte zinc finger protein XlCOF6 isoform X2 [Parasteatoda tepidariorum]
MTHLYFETNEPHTSQFERKKSHVCTYCGYSSEDIQLMTAHTKSLIEGRPYCCCLCCSFVMFNSGNKKLSTSTAKSRRTVHVCPYCNYSTNLLSNMRNHHRTHTGERPFVCKMCSKSFTQINSLKRHMIVHLSKDKL